MPKDRRKEALKMRKYQLERLWPFYLLMLPMCECVTNLQEVITPMEEKDRFKKSQEAEKKRYRFQMKYSKQLEEARLRAGSQAAVKELDQV